MEQLSRMYDSLGKKQKYSTTLLGNKSEKIDDTPKPKPSTSDKLFQCEQSCKELYVEYYIDNDLITTLKNRSLNKTCQKQCVKIYRNEIYANIWTGLEKYDVREH